MIVHGANPFAIPFPQGLASDLPLNHDSFSMTYGPLWALISSAVVLATSGVPWASWLILKLILAASWIACLLLTGKLTTPWPAWRRCMAIAVVGWLPLGVHSSVAEGHNDVTMIAAALLWMALLGSQLAAGPLMLAMSVLTKYVTAPLALADAIYHRGARMLSVAQYVRRVLPAIVIMAVAGLFLFRSLSGLQQTASMVEWKFLRPVDALLILEHLWGVQIPGASFAFMLLFVGIAAIEIYRLWKDTTSENLARAQLAVLTAVLMGAVGHVFCWFFVWCIVYAALAPRFWLSWFIVGAAVIAPFSVVPRLLARGSGELLGNAVPSLLMYGFAVGMVLLYLRFGWHSEAPLRFSFDRERSPDAVEPRVCVVRAEASVEATDRAA
ncbi:hypothetical protein [Variovorax sp. OV329]|uniref:hypothetical protein n=1 Tax=Variovorax sp. OV329 TaxID=1882825 RepID=UPI0008E37F2C|nr:hypothetical protein [Variovorax sp. OV329]SFN23748.1 hypothetical protein SAMN05444747_1191 [Variovorax sp. OV329]